MLSESAFFDHFQECYFSGMLFCPQINKLHERARGIVYNDIAMSFENLLIKKNIFTIDHQNIQSLVIEIDKATNNLLGRNLSKFFVRNNHKLLPNDNTVFMLQITKCYQLLGTINSELHSNPIKKTKFLSNFHIGNKKMATNKLLFQIVQKLHSNLEFINTSLVGRIYSWLNILFYSRF